jgi:hypothetical protein
VNQFNPHPVLEQETQSIIQRITSKTIGTAATISLKDILAADIPKSIKQYFQCEVLSWLNRDLRNTLHLSKLQAGNPIAAHLTRVYTRAIAPGYTFEIREFGNTLENAVHFVENYVCRPEWTLEQFAFEQADRVRFPDLQQKFEYLSDYGYFPTLIQEYIRNRQWQEISRDDFRKLLSRIDEQVVKQHNSRELAYLCRPIFEFILQDAIIEDKAIPLRPLVVFFEDKNMNLMKEYIERICQIRQTDQLTIEQLADIIDDLHSGSAATRLREHLPDTSTAEPDGEIHPETTSDQVSEEQPNPSLLAPFEKTTPLSTQMNDRRNIPLSLTFSGMTGNSEPKLTPSDFPDLKYMINEQQRARFVKAIFQRDEAYFNVVIEALNGMTTWRDASLYLETFYNSSGIDPFESDVVEFTDLVQHRFSPPQ